MSKWGNFGGPNKLLEAYIEWRDDRLARIEEGELEEADTRADFPEFLYGPVKSSMWHGYQRVSPMYRKYARVESLTDFRERRLRGLNALKGIGYVGEHGEYPGMVRTERPAATLAVDTYGGVYGITRHAIRNDDSGELLNRNPADMGFAMGNFVAETMTALIESNPLAPDGIAMAHVSRGNLVTTALSEDSLADAITFMEDQRDDDGYRILIRAAVLSVKTARMELIARRILNSALSGATVNWTGAAGIGSAIFDKGTDNPLQNILPNDAVVRDPFWSDANDWRLFAAAGDVPSFAIGFLDGKEEPFVGIKDPMVRNALGPGVDPYTFDFDAVEFKVRHDFGVAPVDPRGYYLATVT